MEFAKMTSVLARSTPCRRRVAPGDATTNIHRSAVEIVLKIDDFRDATPPVFIGLQIRERKVNLRTVVHVFLYTLLFVTKNIQILNCPWNCGLPWVKNVRQISGDAVSIEDLNIPPNKKWYQKDPQLRWIPVAFTSRKSSFYSSISTALRWIFVVSKIGEREVILRILAHLFPTHHFLVGSIVGFLIPAKFDGVFWFLPRETTERGQP